MKAKKSSSSSSKKSTSRVASNNIGSRGSKPSSDIKDSKDEE